MFVYKLMVTSHIYLNFFSNSPHEENRDGEMGHLIIIQLNTCCISISLKLYTVKGIVSQAKQTYIQVGRVSFKAHIEYIIRKLRSHYTQRAVTSHVKTENLNHLTSFHSIISYGIVYRNSRYQKLLYASKKIIRIMAGLKMLIIYTKKK